VAETDTTNTKIKGGNMGYGIPLMDRIREHKTTIIQAAVVVAIAVVVSALMILTLSPSKGDYNAAVAHYDGEFVRLGASINTWGTGLTNQIGDVEADVQNQATTLLTVGMKAADNEADIETLQTWANDAEARITTVEAQNSPPEGYLTGAVGNYTLHTRCSVAGNFTANIHLVYSPPVSVGNATTQDEALQVFYGGIDWAAPMVKNYVCTLTYNSTVWGISQVWFNIGTFAMAANNETAVDIIFSGLNSTYDPDFAYVEVWPVLK